MRCVRACHMRARACAHTSERCCSGFLSYAPWLFWAYWACPSFTYSLWFAAPFALLVVFFAVLDTYLPHLQEYFTHRCP